MLIYNPLLHDTIGNEELSWLHTRPSPDRFPVLIWSGKKNRKEMKKKQRKKEEEKTNKQNKQNKTKKQKQKTKNKKKKKKTRTDLWRT